MIIQEFDNLSVSTTRMEIFCEISIFILLKVSSELDLCSVYIFASPVKKEVPSQKRQILRSPPCFGVFANFKVFKICTISITNSRISTNYTLIFKQFTFFSTNPILYSWALNYAVCSACAAGGLTQTAPEGRDPLDSHSPMLRWMRAIIAAHACCFVPPTGWWNEGVANSSECEYI